VPAVDVTTVPDVGATIGVEEEFHLLHPATGLLTNGAGRILHAQRDSVAEPELQRSMIETATPICTDLAQVGHGVRESRRSLLDSADRAGLWVAGAGTLPESGRPMGSVFPNPRYERIAEDYRQLVTEQQVCACQVQVGVPDRELAIRMIRRVRVWLPALLALSAGSPYFLGADTGYASYRAIVLSRWPTAGPPPSFGSAHEYDRTIARLISSGVIRDPGMIYFDIRASARYPTLEIRVADACPLVEDVLLLAALARALVVTAAAEERADTPLPAVDRVLLRAATWRAARSGLTGMLVDPVAAEPVTAPELIQRLLAYLRPALEERGDWETAGTLTKEVLRRGTSAQRQRIAYGRAGQPADVVHAVVAETRQLWSGAG
jgi:carboxylate-amine ligase